MGNEIVLIHSGGEEHIASIGKAGWREMRKVLPLMLDFINRSMRDKWAIYHEEHPALLWDGDPERTISIDLRDGPKHQRAFTVETLINDRSEEVDEIYFLDADEVIRLFAWSAYLDQHHGAFGLYAPVIGSLKSRLDGIEKYVSSTLLK